MSFFERDLANIAKMFPGIWQTVERIVLQKKASDWPNFCFMPSFFWLKILEDHETDRTIAIKEDQALLEYAIALGTWRYTRGIYRFDTELYENLTKTKIRGNIPANVLLNIPEWCIYIETPGLFYKSRPVSGFYFLNDYCNPSYPIFKFVTVTNLSDNKSIEMSTVNLIHQNINMTIENLFEATEEIFEKQKPHGYRSTHTQEEIDLLHKLFPLLLYICSEQPEIDNKKEPGDKPQHAEITKTRHGPRIFPAPKTRIWDIGKRIGETIKRERENASRTGKSPHIRRAHWHGYWTGPRSGEQIFKYNWIPPVFVVGSIMAHSNEQNMPIHIN